jgi:hypothetical protein
VPPRREHREHQPRILPVPSRGRQLFVGYHRVDVLVCSCLYRRSHRPRKKWQPRLLPSSMYRPPSEGSSSTRCGRQHPTCILPPIGIWKVVRSLPRKLHSALLIAVALKGPRVSFLPKGISASALMAGDAMALLCAQVDTYLIQLLRYLHVQAQAVMRKFKEANSRSFLAKTFPA